VKHKRKTTFSVCIFKGGSCCAQDASTNWQFDIFALADATPGYTLSLLTFHVMKQSGLVQEFSLDEPKLQAYLRQIEQGYNPLIPYHNRYGWLWAG
jgi:hypothetical protein